MDRLFRPILEREEIGWRRGRRARNQGGRDVGFFGGERGLRH